MSSKTKASLPPPAEDALRLLFEGHERFLGGEQPPRAMADGAEWKRAMAEQDPVAVLVTCADARILPNLLFDLAPGRLFVVRVAGPVASAEAVASVEYAVRVLGVPLVMVLGHGRCGAVAAALARRRAETSDPKLLELHSLLGLIDQVALAPEDLAEAPADLRRSEAHNAEQVAEQLAARSLGLARAIRQGELGIVAARLELDTGRVDRLT